MNEFNFKLEIDNFAYMKGPFQSAKDLTIESNETDEMLSLPKIAIGK